MKLLYVGIGAICGLLISFNWGVQIPTDNVGNETEAMETLLGDYISEQASLQTRIENLRNSIESAELEIEGQTNSVNLKVLESLRARIGLGVIEGKGIEVILDNSILAGKPSDGREFDLVQASDLRDVVNALFAGGADAVTVNGRRIIATSTINSAGSKILVNGINVTAPYRIEAVGEPETMLRRMEDKSLMPLLYSRITGAKIRLIIQIRDYVTLSEYRGELKSELLNLIN